MSKVNENDTKVLKSKRFVVRMSLVGKNQIIEFTTKKGKVITYNHDKVYEVMKSKLETLDCWSKYNINKIIEYNFDSIELARQYYNDIVS